MRKGTTLAPGQSPIAALKGGLGKVGSSPQSAYGTVQDILHSSRVELNDIDLEISALKSKLDTLLARRTEIVEQIDHCARALSPEKRLPYELLCEIFVRCLEGKPIEIPSKECVSGLPWSLSLVSRRWRAVALGEPRLWNSLHVSYDGTAPGRITALAHSVALSGGSLIRLTAQDYVGDNLTDLVSPISDQLRMLSLHFAERNVPSILHTPEQSFGVLESLEIVVAVVGRAIDHPSPNSFPDIHHAPSLHRVTIHTPPYSQTTSILKEFTPSLPWTQLTALVFENVVFPSTGLLEILSHCIELKTLVLDLSSTSEEDLMQLINMEDITLPRLTSMRLFDKVAPGFLHFIDHLTLPSLESLKIFYYTESAIVHSIIALIGRSACPLVEVRFCVSSMSAEEFDCIACLLPALRRFELLGTAIPESVLLSLLQGRLFPLVEDLACSAESLDMFLDLLEDVWEAYEEGGGAWRGPKQIQAHSLVDDLDLFVVDFERVYAIQAKFIRHGLRFEVFE